MSPYFHLGMLVALSIISYLDRVCISIAISAMSEELTLSPAQIGWVFGMFLAGYGIGELPSGYLVDLYGAFWVLLRIVLVWSCFTALTGLSQGFISLLVIRLLFGIGEAGTYPASSSVIHYAFSAATWARAHSIIFMASRFGCACTPMIMRPLQRVVGWRLAFAIMSAPGLLWSCIWAWLCRDLRALRPGSSASRARYSTTAPWRRIVGSRSIWALCVIYASSGAAQFWFFSWGPLYLEREKHLSNNVLTIYSSLPCSAAAVATLLGGFISDFVVRKCAIRRARAIVGGASLVLCGAVMVAAVMVEQDWLCITGLALGLASVDFGLPNMWAAAVGIGGEHTGFSTALCNSAAISGGMLMSLFFGYAVEVLGYNLPLLGIGCLQVLAAVAWLAVDPTPINFRTSTIEDAIPFEPVDTMSSSPLEDSTQ